MMPNGDKENEIIIKGLKIVLKPHTLMMATYFFSNAWP